MSQEGTSITQDQRNKVAKHIGLVHGRLGECHAAFMLFMEIENLREKNPFLIDSNVQYGEFWREVHFCALSKMIIDIGALVDKKTRVSASLYSLYKLCVDLRCVHCIDAKGRIDSIHKTWQKYRSKLVAHTDQDRNSLIAEFANQGFTIATIKEEIDQLTYAYTILFATLHNRPVPTFEDAKQFNAGFAATGERVRSDTKAFLDKVEPFLPQFEGGLG